jgi:hypothetical protein
MLWNKSKRKREERQKQSERERERADSIFNWHNLLVHIGRYPRVLFLYRFVRFLFGDLFLNR